MTAISDEELRLERFAMSIVHLVGQIQSEKLPDSVTSVDFVRIRQATNDDAIDAIMSLIASHDREIRIDELEEITSRSANIDGVTYADIALRINELKGELNAPMEGEEDE